MAVTEAQARRAVRRAEVDWDEAVRDPRSVRNQRHAHHGMLNLLVAAFACGRVRLRRVEDLSRDVGRRARRRLGIGRRVSDTALWRLLARQGVEGLRQTAQRQVRDLAEAKLLERTFPLGVLSIDGKSVWTSTRRQLAGAKTSVDEKTGLVTSSLMSVLAVLTSARAQPCLDMEMIGAKAGESPAFRQLFPRVCDAFGSHFAVVTVDAGMTSRDNARLVLGRGKDYLFALKGNQAQLHAQATDAFLGQPGRARAHTAEVRNGQHLFRELYTLPVAPHEVDFPGAVELWQVVQRSTGGSTETRYFVSSLPLERLTPTQKLSLVRLHWGVENGHHWTADVALEEDDVQPCQASRASVEVVAWLRVLAYNLLATWRARQPLKDKLPISWARAMEQLRDAYVFDTPERLATLL